MSDLTRRDFLAAAAPVPLAHARSTARPEPVEGRALAAGFRAAQEPNLAYLSLAEAAALIKSRRLSPIALTQAILDRIDRLDARIGAFITVTRDEALGAAREAERQIARGHYRGSLH